MAKSGNWSAPKLGGSGGVNKTRSRRRTNGPKPKTRAEKARFNKTSGPFGLKYELGPTFVQSIKNQAKKKK